MAGKCVHSVNNISNNKIKEIVKLHQKKYRDEEGLFIAEGFKAVEELIKSNIEIKEIYALKDFNTLKIKQPINIIKEAEIKKISTTASVCEILAIAKKKNYEITEISKQNKIILLDSISDPGNLGTIIRSAAAFGIEGIILFDDCVDIYSSKVVRSATGNLFKTPIIKIKTIDELNKYFKNHTKVATSLSKENNISLDECSKLEKYIIMFGSEAKGLSKELTQIAEKNIKLEMKNNVESLNLSVCSSIIMYELFCR